MTRHVENAVIVTLLLVMVGIGVLVETTRDGGVGPAQSGPVCPAPTPEGGR